MNSENKPPFILVDGAGRSGKTSFIRALSDAEVESATFPTAAYPQGIPFVQGRIAVDEALTVYLLEPCGGWSFDLVRDLPDLPVQLLGVVLMIDSVETDAWGEAMPLLFMKYLPNCPVPLVVAANRQDHPDASSAADLRIAVQAPDGLAVLPCVATDRESVKQVMLQLLYRVLETVQEPEPPQGHG